MHAALDGADDANVTHFIQWLYSVDKPNSVVHPPHYTIGGKPPARRNYLVSEQDLIPALPCADKIESSSVMTFKDGSTLQIFVRGGVHFKSGVSLWPEAKCEEDLLRVACATGGALSFTLHIWPWAGKQDELDSEGINCKMVSSTAVDHAAFETFRAFPTTLRSTAKVMARNLTLTPKPKKLGIVISAGWAPGRVICKDSGYPLIPFQMERFQDPGNTWDVPLELERTAHYVLLETEAYLGNMLCIFPRAEEDNFRLGSGIGIDLTLSVMALEPNMIASYMIARHDALGELYAVHACFVKLHILAYARAFMCFLEQHAVAGAVNDYLRSLRGHVRALDMIITNDTPRCTKCLARMEKRARCSCCLSAYYCSTACQKAHFPEHKLRCALARQVLDALKL